MITIRRSKDRGHAQHGWLESYHSFSFAGYQDARFTGFRDLIVINEDRVQPSEGFGQHGHQDMEIISYVLEGELAHQDSTGTSSVIRPGDVQRMSAGKGVQHSEFNNSKDQLVHFLQIWIKPRKYGIKPCYEEQKFGPEEKKNLLKLIVSPNSEGGSLSINQDAKIYSALLDPGKKIRHDFGSSRYGWLQVLRGSLELNGEPLNEGDGASISDEPKTEVLGKTPTEFLLFDLP